MIEVILRDLRWRVLLVALAGLVFFLWELSVQHEAVVGTAEMGPEGISAPAAYLAGLAMIILLAGFVSTDRREGYARLFFAHPTSPLALYGLRWIVSYVIAVGAAVVLFLALQLYLWGEFRGGGPALLLPALVALVYGGLMAFLSGLLRGGDAVVALLLYLPTLLPPGVIEFAAGIAGTTAKQVILLLLPPQSTALTTVYQGLVEGGNIAWGAVAFVLGYAVVWLALGVLLVRLREIP
ncbi:MAG TPA: hypothetical protein VFL93_06960 [Longimicrobiaceae bacterium]|nr:hypothetical protein [Longimicrobiaceae bacterium]